MQIKHTLLCGLLALTSPLAYSVESSLIRGPLENTGVDVDASGTVRSYFKHSKVKLCANLKGLTADAAYTFTVDGETQAEFTADADGTAVLTFSLDPTGTQFDLDFDPRGKLLAVNDGIADVLSMVYSGPDEPVELVVDERTSLVAAEGVSGRVEARYLDQKNKSRFILHLLGLDRGTYTLRVAGEDKAEIDLNKGRSALVVFEVNKHSALKANHGKGNGNGKGSGQGKGNGNGKSKKNVRAALDFDPRGELIELVQDDVVVFSGEMLAQIEGLPDETETTVDLVSAGVDPDAAGSVVILDDGTGDVTLTVGIDNLPVGAYSLFIGGTQRGTINVTDDGTGVTHGEIVFATTPEGTEVLLDFAYAGQLLEVKQADVLHLSATLP